MKERTRNIAVGLTAMVALVGVGAMLVLFGFVPRWMEQGYRVSVMLPDAGGVYRGSRVFFNGIDIGRVESVQLLPLPDIGVMVHTRIKDEVDLPREATAVVNRPLIGGTASLSIDIASLTPEQRTDFLPKDDTARIKGSSEGLASQFASELKEAFREGMSTLTTELAGPREKFEQIADDFRVLSQEWTRVGKNIGDLTEPRTVAAVDTGEAPPNLVTTFERADQRLREMQQLLTSLNDWVSDPELREDVRQAAAGTRQLTEKLSATADKFGELADSTNQNVDRLARRYVAVADDMSAAVEAMRKLLDQTRQGQGTMGKLVADPALYNNLNDAAQRLIQAAEEMNLLLEKWRKEGLPIRF